MLTSENLYHHEIKYHPSEDNWESGHSEECNWELLIETNEEGIKRHWFKQNYGGLQPQSSGVLYQ